MAVWAVPGVGEVTGGAAERSTAKIAVCFQNRYNTTAQAIHRLLRSGDL